MHDGALDEVCALLARLARGGLPCRATRLGARAALAHGLLSWRAADGFCGALKAAAVRQRAGQPRAPGAAGVRRGRERRVRRRWRAQRWQCPRRCTCALRRCAWQSSSLHCCPWRCAVRCWEWLARALLRQRLRWRRAPAAAVGAAARWRCRRCTSCWRHALPACACSPARAGGLWRSPGPRPRPRTLPPPPRLSAPWARSSGLPCAPRWACSAPQ